MQPFARPNLGWPFAARGIGMIGDFNPRANPAQNLDPHDEPAPNLRQRCRRCQWGSKNT